VHREVRLVDSNVERSIRDAAATVALVHDTLGPGKDLTDLLEQIVEAMDATGCVLWEVAPGSDLAARPPEGALFVLASWFRGSRSSFARHDLPLAGSCPGRAVVDRRIVSIDDFARDGGAERSDRPPMASIRNACSIDLELLDGNRGALSLYREGAVSLSEAEFDRLRQLAVLVPGLYQTICDRTGFALIKTVDGLLDRAESEARGQLLSLGRKERLVQDICHEVAASLGCLEVSIFLEHRVAEAGVFRRRGTTLPIDLAGPEEYAPTIGDGLTGWVLERGRPVWIFDLANYESDRARIEREYPGLHWKDHLKIERIARQFLGYSEGNGPPLSVMATPILVGPETLGIIRCSVRQPHAYSSYFSPRDLELLKLVAAQVGQCWSIWLNRIKIDRENQSWGALIQRIGELNDFAQRQLDREQPDDRPILDRALDIACEVIPGTDLASVRLVDVDRRMLTTAALRTRQRFVLDRAVRATYERSFVIDAPSASAAAILAGRQLVVDPTQPGQYPDISSNSTRSCHTPILVRNRVIGVLNLVSFGAIPFSSFACKAAEMLARQLGLYSRLAATINQLKGDRKKQLQTWKDFSHQIKGPIIKAERRADRASRAQDDNPELKAVRGLCRKAKHVTMSLRLLADLANDIPVRPDSKPVDSMTLIKKLYEACQDAAILIDPGLNIQFDLQAKSFEMSRVDQVGIDLDLVEQALDNLLDNAAKYSDPDTTVVVFGEVVSGQSLTIIVRNQGMEVRILPGEVRACVEREWRGKEAKRRTEDGSGIGLWMVDHIMKGHAGRLVIEPTTPEGITDVRLVFPMSAED
jgi:signal transduction histidine kinase